MLSKIPDPHRDQPVLIAGAPVEEARAALILVHGRGASAGDIMTLVPEIDQPGFAYLAPQAADFTWYPYSFLAPIAQNEPGLSSGLAVLAELVAQLGEAGLPPEQVFLLGFSQGACLALEFVARNRRRYGGIVGLSGGLIGPEGTNWMEPGAVLEGAGPLAGTPVFLGCSDTDPHIPKERVLESVQVLGDLGAQVTYRLYPGMGHTVNQDELDVVREMLGERN